MPVPTIVYVDVDDTLIRSSGSRRIPMASVVEQVRLLHAEGAMLYCWSTGGADYARASAIELGLEGCFVAFLPKPNVMIDDQPPAEWRGLVCVHPNEAVGKTLADYARDLAQGRVR
jgi:hypothetical protein